MNPRTRECTPGVAIGRMRKAEQFADAAELISEFAEEVGDAYVTLLVHAGIAAADVICCQELGKHAQGDNHADAVDLLGRVGHGGTELSKALATLLAAKTRAGYSHQPVTSDTRLRCRRAADKLMRGARDRTTG